MPGLIAYQCVRQPIKATLISTGVVTMLSHVVLLTGVLLNVLPHGQRRGVNLKSVRATSVALDRVTRE